MIITKLALPRRTVLRGTGTMLALPLLNAMVPALSAMSKTAAAPVHRLAFLGNSNGMFMPHFLPKGTGGTNFELSPILTPLASFKEQMVVVSGLSHLAAEAREGQAGGPHARGAGAFLCGVNPKRTEGADIEAGKTIDQYAADRLGEDTQLRSLELRLESSFTGNCDQGYSCTYVNTYSWRTPTQPLPMEDNPRVIFERLFGDGGTVEAQRAQSQKDHSILDWVTDEMTRLHKRLGTSDRTTVNDYLEAVRDVERRIQKAEQETVSLPEATRPVGIPDSHDDHAKLMFDLMFLAFQADITRVVTFQLSREQSALTYPFIGVNQPHHVCSHHEGDPEKIAGYTKIKTYYATLLARLAEKMRATPDGDGSLLDHSMLFFGATLGDGSLHSLHDLPAVLVGGGCGQLQGGRYLKSPLDTPFMNLGLSLLDKVGVELKSIGDSTGRIVDL